mmetsp:Transcript_32725/g.76738  ORF Transcript_32725/g.76738 Transcript_32725/m.76738 type:complete len:246 (-) Transcript_32725:414-1151(-)
MCGIAELFTMSALPIRRVLVTAATAFDKPYFSPTPAAAAADETKANDVIPTAGPCAPNMGRIFTGWGVGMLALGSPIWAQAICPPLITISGLEPKLAGLHKQMSAILPTSTLPMCLDIPCATAGLIVYFATYLFARVLSSPLEASSGRGPLCSFIFEAVCHVRVTTSPMRPMAWESELMMEIAPMSCRISSAAIVSARIRDSAKATSSGMFLSKWWHTISMSKCSSMVLTVNGLVGFVELGITFL